MNELFSPAWLASQLLCHISVSDREEYFLWIEVFSLACSAFLLKKSSISLGGRCLKNRRKRIRRLKVIYSYLPEGSKSCCICWWGVGTCWWCLSNSINLTETIEKFWELLPFRSAQLALFYIGGGGGWRGHQAVTLLQFKNGWRWIAETLWLVLLAYYTSFGIPFGHQGPKSESEFSRL